MNITRDNVHELLIKYIALTRDTIDLFIDLGLENNFPIVGLTLVHLNTDSIGPFWMNLKTFEMGYDDLINKNLKELVRDLNSLSSVLNMDLSSYITTAEESWQSIT